MGRSRQASGQRWPAVFSLRIADHTPEPAPWFHSDDSPAGERRAACSADKEKEWCPVGAGRPQVAGQAPGRRPEGPACGLHASVYPCSFTALICADSPDCETLKNPLFWLIKVSQAQNVFLTPSSFCLCTSGHLVQTRQEHCELLRTRQRRPEIVGDRGPMGAPSSESAPHLSPSRETSDQAVAAEPESPSRGQKLMATH